MAKHRILELGSTTLTSLIAIYFTFNIVYTKQLYPVLIFIATALCSWNQGQTSYSQQFNQIAIFTGQIRLLEYV